MAQKCTDTSSLDSSSRQELIGSPGNNVAGEQQYSSAADADYNRLDLTTLEYGRTRTMMMSSPPPSGVQTDADGLILPKKLINPCLESTDRRQLHRELKFNNKIGKSVLNQKTELQRAYEKQRERQQQHDHSPSNESAVGGLRDELSRVIMERAQKHERNSQDASDAAANEDMQYVNPEYLNVRAKLRTGQRGELK